MFFFISISSIYSCTGSTFAAKPSCTTKIVPSYLKVSLFIKVTPLQTLIFSPTQPNPLILEQYSYIESYVEILSGLFCSGLLNFFISSQITKLK